MLRRGQALQSRLSRSSSLGGLHVSSPVGEPVGRSIPASAGGRGAQSSPGISWRLPRNVGWSCRTSPVRLLWIGSVKCGAGYSGPLFPAVSGRVAPCLKGAGQCWGVFWVRPGSRPAVGGPAVSRPEGLGLGRLGVTHDAGSVAEGLEGHNAVVSDPELPAAQRGYSLDSVPDAPDAAGAGAQVGHPALPRFLAQQPQPRVPPDGQGPTAL